MKMKYLTSFIFVQSNEKIKWIEIQYRDMRSTSSPLDSSRQKWHKLFSESSKFEKTHQFPAFTCPYTRPHPKNTKQTTTTTTKQISKLYMEILV